MSALTGVRIIELGAIGPSPFCCMLLADMGADVLRIDRLEPADLGAPIDPRFNLLNRNKRSAAIDLRVADGAATVRRMLVQADVLVEGFRPGVSERLGLGPTEALAINPRLVYGRMTGWGQNGPLAHAAGHDINYIALTGALDAIGDEERPAIPVNLLGDYGGGALFLALGIVAALLEARRSDRGQVIDAAMVDGVSALMTSLYGMLGRGMWRGGRGNNLLDGGAPFYAVYETLDGKHVAIGAIEARFFRELLARLDLDPALGDMQRDCEQWPTLRRHLAEAFRARTREELCALLEGHDACFTPVLKLAEAYEHPHLRQRGTLVERFGALQPAPAPRFSRTPSNIRSAPPLPGAHTRDALADYGFATAEIDALMASGAIG